MTPTAWADLPNAKHIDRILADLGKNPGGWYDARVAAWDAASDSAWTAAWDAAWDAVWDAVWDAARGDAMSAASDAAWDAAMTAGCGALLALIAYDDCAYLLDEKPEHVQMLALLGNEKALLLYQACVALQKHEPL